MALKLQIIIYGYLYNYYIETKHGSVFKLVVLFFYVVFEIGFDMIEVEVFEGEQISLRINQTNNETTGQDENYVHPSPELLATSGTATSMTLYKIDE